MTTNEITIIPPRWWTDPVWLRLSWSCPRCGWTTTGVPEAGEPCGHCGYRETD